MQIPTVHMAGVKSSAENISALRWSHQIKTLSWLLRLL